MNKIFKTKYCEKRQTYLATHEKAKIGVPITTSASNGRNFLKYNVIALAISALFAKSPLAQGLVNPNVVAGQATINAVNQTNTVIKQTTNKAVINWEKFTIPKDNAVNFQQPDTGSITLNRVLGSQKSEIYGSLKANGQVWLLNPNGTLIGENGSINAHGFMATTHQISNDQFMNGNYSLRKNNKLSGDIQNLGVIDIADGGYAVLSADKVVNKGVIGARLGTVALAAGEAITIDLVGDQLLSFQVDSTISDGSQKSVTNSGTISANGGHVLLTAKAASNIVKSVVNSTGVVEAVSVEKKNGKIVFTSGSEGVTSVEGTVDISGKNIGETAGSVEIFGKDLKVANAKIDATGIGGGGNVYVGGGWQGAKVGDHKPAKTVTVASDTLIDASAVSNGDGGEVVIWSDVPDPSSVTRAHGVIKAEGGKHSGDGGKIETSGNALYTQNIQVSTRAGNGEYGSWLLDPTTITIGTTDNNTTVRNNTYQATADSGDINKTTLSNALSSNNVTIQADNIIVSSGVSDANTTSLSLDATNDITLNENIARVGAINLTTGSTGTLSGTGNLSSSGNITLQIGADSNNYAGSITTPGNLTKNGSGILTLSNSTNTIGATTVVAGGVKLGHGNAFGAGAVSVQGGAFVDLNGQTVDNLFELAGVGPNHSNALQNTNTGTPAVVNGAITLKQVNDGDASVKIGHNGDIYIKGSITDASDNVASGRLVKGGAGTLFLQAANSYTGGTEIYNGTLVADHSAALGDAVSIKFTGGTLAITANTQALTSDKIDSSSSSSIKLDVARSVPYSLSDLTLSSGGIIKTGAGNLAFTGVTVLSQGIDVQAGDVAIGDNSTSTSFNGNIQIAENSSVNFRPAGNSMVYDGSVSGAGTIIIQGTNSDPSANGERFTFTGNAAHTGGVSITGAILQVGNGSGSFQDYSGPLSIDATSGLELNPGTSGTISSAITSAGAIRNISNPGQDITFSNILSHSGPTGVASNGSITFNVTSGTLALTGDITGDGKIIKTGSGQLNLEGTNTFTGGLRIADGNTQLGASSLPTTGTTLQLGGSAVLKVSSATPDYSKIIRFDNTSSNLRISVPAGNTYKMDTDITSQTGGILSKRGDGELILNANFDFGNGAAIYGGDLVVGTGGTSGRLNLSNSDLTFHNTGGRYIYNRSAAVTKTHPFRVTDSSASGSIVNRGTGILTLTGAIDAGITVPVNPTNGTYLIPGSNTSNSTAGPTNTAADFGTLSISGSLTEGQTITANYTITDDNGFSGTPLIRWYHVSDPNTSIASGGNTYVLSGADVGEKIAFEVTFSDNDGFSEQSSPFPTDTAVEAAVTVANNDQPPPANNDQPPPANNDQPPPANNNQQPSQEPEHSDQEISLTEKDLLELTGSNIGLNGSDFDPNLLFLDQVLETPPGSDSGGPVDPTLIPGVGGTIVQDPFYQPPPEYSSGDFFEAIANVGLSGEELTGSFEFFKSQDSSIPNDPFYDPSAYFIEAANFAGETGLEFDQIAEFAGEVDRQVFLEAAELTGEMGLEFDQIAEFAGEVDRQVFLEAAELTGEYQLDFFEVAQVAEKVDVQILDDLAVLAGEGGSVVQVLDNAIEEAYDVVRQVGNVPPPGDFGPPPGDFGEVAGGPPPADLGGPGGDLGGPEVVDVAGDPGLELAPPPGDLGGPPPGDFGPGPGDLVDVAGGPGPGEFLAPAPTDFAPPIPGDLAALPGDFAPPPGLDLGEIGEFGAEAASFGDFTEFGDVGAPPPGDIGGLPPGDVGPGPGPGGDLGAPPPGDVPPPGDGPPLADGPDGPPPGDGPPVGDSPPPGDEPAPGELADGPAGDDGSPPGDEPSPESAEAPGDDVSPGEEPAPESADAGEPAPEVAADGPAPGDAPPAGDTAGAGDAVAAADAPPADAPEASTPAPSPAPVTADAAPPPPPPVEPPPPSPVPTQKAPTPVDSADAGDKTLAAVAAPSPPKPASQPQAVSVKTVSVVPGGVVNVQVPVPPRPPAGLAGAPKIPSVGNSSNW